MPQNTSQHQRLCGPFSARKTTSENYTIKCKISSLSCCCWCSLRCCCCCCCCWQQLEIVIVVICWKFIQTAALLPSRLTATNCSASTVRPQFSLSLQSSFYVLRSSVVSLSVCLSVRHLVKLPGNTYRWSQSACQSASLSHCPHTPQPLPVPVPKRKQLSFE